MAWAFFATAVNSFLTLHIHFKRGGTPNALSSGDGASKAEREWMFAYAQLEHPRTLSLMAWRRSCMTVMVSCLVAHCLFQSWLTYQIIEPLAGAP